MQDFNQENYKYLGLQINFNGVSTESKLCRAGRLNSYLMKDSCSQ
jgi:hypothetical protein